MVRDLSCFGDASVQVADAASSSSSSAGGGVRRRRDKGAAGPQSRVTCLYQARLAGRPCALSVAWTRGGGLAGQAAAFSVAVDDRGTGDVKPWLFSRRKGSRRLGLAGAGNAKVEVFWDLSSARFGAGPEPVGGLYVAVVCGVEMVLLLGDMGKEARRRTGGAGRPATEAPPRLVARREHVVGRDVFAATARFGGAGNDGPCHDVVVECDTAAAGVDEPCLELRIDGRPVVRVKRLRWKFRGNQTVLVDGSPVEVFWDVHGWLFGSAATSNVAVFVFQTCQAPQRSYSQIFGEPRQLQGHGFSLILNAWKVE